MAEATQPATIGAREQRAIGRQLGRNLDLNDLGGLVQNLQAEQDTGKHMGMIRANKRSSRGGLYGFFDSLGLGLYAIFSAPAQALDMAYESGKSATRGAYKVATEDIPNFWYGTAEPVK